MASLRGISTSRQFGRRLAWVAGALLTAGLLVAFLTEPTRSADGPDDPSGPAAHKKSADSLKKLGLGFYGYADDHRGQMPPAAVCDKDGRPLYSWRVLILPYIGEKKLYEQFQLDEPWDGPHNKKLLEKMPPVFAPVGAEVKKKHQTYYQVFGGPDTAFREKNRGPYMPGSYLDGASETFLIVEAGEAVPWTAPQDLKYDARKPVPRLGGLFSDGFHAYFADDHVRFFKKGKLGEKTLRALITPAGRDLLGSDY